MESSGIAAGLVAALSLSLLVGCGTPRPSMEAPKSASTDTGLDRMERLTLTANRCWFKSRDPAFTKYSLAPELSSFSGRPRFLLVPKGRLEDRPLLVVEGQTGSRDVATYGPLLQTSLHTRIESDLSRWRDGDTTCAVQV